MYPYEDDENSIQWGSTVRLQTRPSKPFTSIDGTVIDPDVVIFKLYPPNNSTPFMFTWTNGNTPPDPTYTVQRKVVTITAVTPSNPAVGSVLIATETPHNYWPGQTITIAGVSPSGYSGVFQVASIVSPTSFTVANTTTGTATLTSPTSTLTGAFYIEIDNSAYPAGPWGFYVQGQPGVSGLDTTKTKVRYLGDFYVNGYVTEE